MRIILASTSPRRQVLLGLLAVPFEVRSPVCDEEMVPGRNPQDLARSFAEAKARSVSKAEPAAVVLGSDTLIELEGATLGKPSDVEAARKMLRRLAGRSHLVHTAVSLSFLAKQIERTRVSTSQVSMKPYDEVLHERYLATGDSLGKAGAYSIQGPGHVLIERLNGDFTTVVGLPLRLVAELLIQAGIEIPVDVERLYDSRPYENWRSFS